MSIEFVGHRPPPVQTGVVLRYCGYREVAAGPVRTREHPGTFLPIIIDSGRGWRISDPARPRESAMRLGSFVAGLTDGPVLVEHPGSAECVQVDLTPLGARRLLGLPLSELSNRAIPLEDVLGPAARDLVEQVADAPDWASRFRLIEDTITARLASAPPVRSELAWVLSCLTRPRPAPVGALARELGWSHRRLISLFRDTVGLPPKRVARIARLERLEASLRASPETGWARLAAEHGFADQPHLAREVRALTGLTPSELRDEAVNFVHDAEVLAA